jgi:hypothetical protein
MWNAEALKAMWHSVGRRPVKARLVMLHASLECLGPYVFDLMMVVTCYGIAWRTFWVMMVGIRVSGRLVVHLVCLVAKRSRPYAAVLKVGRVAVKYYG